MYWAAIPAAMAGLVILFLALPLVLVVRGGRCADDAPLGLECGVSLWLGLVGITCRRPAGRKIWEVGPRLCGWTAGIWYRFGTSHSHQEVPEEAAEARGADETEPETPPESAEDKETPLLARVRQQASSLRPLVGPAWGLVRSCPKALSIRRLQVTGSIGLQDPATTGWLQGLLHVLYDVMPGPIEVDVESDFVEAGVRGEVVVKLHLHLGKLLFFIVWFALIAGTRWLFTRLSLWRTRRKVYDGIVG